eukprot:07662_1
MSSGLSPLTNLTWMPRRGSVVLNWLYVPPRKLVETMLSPASASVVMARNWAAWPLDVATARTPPSNAATRFSKTSVVGFMMRVMLPNSSSAKRRAAWSAPLKVYEVVAMGTARELVVGSGTCPAWIDCVSKR